MHLEETRGQIGRLDQVFKTLGQEPKGTDCPAIDGIIKESNEVAGEIAEINRYGTLIAWAESLGHEEVVRLLTTNLNEEKATNTKLNTMAVRKGVNAKREKLFHGVQAIRLTPIDSGAMFGRTGMLAHTYILGANGQSNGCVSFKDYTKFLEAFSKGDIDHLVVVPDLWNSHSVQADRWVRYASAANR